MICTANEATTTATGGQELRVVFQNNNHKRVATVFSVHRGGCLYIGEVKLLDRTTGRIFRFETRRDWSQDQEGETSAYVTEMWNKHMNGAA